MTTSNNVLHGKRALVVGVANEQSLAWAITEYLHAAGAEVAISYQRERRVHRLQALIDSTQPQFAQQCDVNIDADVESLFSTLSSHWDKFDILVHAVAFADLQALSNRLVDINSNDFLTCINTSVYSLIKLSQHAEKFMQDNGGSIVTLSYHGAQKVIPGYNVMGVAKAALEHAVKYLAYDLGPHKIRVNAVSAGPIKTLSSLAISGFNEKLEHSEQRSPLRNNISAYDVAALTGFLCGPGSQQITGGVHYVDSGLNILGA